VALPASELNFDEFKSGGLHEKHAVAIILIRILHPVVCIVNDILIKADDTTISTDTNQQTNSSLYLQYHALFLTTCFDSNESSSGVYI
jgi:hypothetical protein